MVQPKTAIYCRVSTADQSCERQEHDLRAYAEKAGWQIAGVWKETASGSKDGRKQRQEILALAQARKLDIVLVTELTRWGRSTMDLIHTLQQLQSWGVSLIAQSGLQFDLGTSQGKLMATIMSSLAEFESDLIRERVKSGIAAAKARGKKIGRQPGQRIKSDRLAPKVLSMVEEGTSYRAIADELDISKNTVTDIVKRHRLLQPVSPAASDSLPTSKRNCAVQNHED
ncbi:MAG: recombinase family protein [Candidatus Obscuribacterales bacterium]|nr:recombinase family protein [Candidatus Obscuribacterales bacterium]